MRHWIADFFIGLTKGMNALMGFLHKGMKMFAALGGDWRYVKKQIHQHGFTAPDSAININPRRPIAGWLSARQKPTQTRPWFLLLQGLAQIIQLHRRMCLCRIGLNTAVVHQSLITVYDRSRSIGR